MTEPNITTLVSPIDGMVYLRTQHGNSAAEIAESLKPYIGRTMTCELPNNYGHYRRCRAVLLAVTGEDVTVRVPSLDYETTISAFDAFGTNCTTIEPERKD